MKSTLTRENHVKKSAKLLQGKKKSAGAAKSRSVKWSIEKSNTVRKAGALPTSGENCGGGGGGK